MTVTFSYYLHGARSSKKINVSFTITISKFSNRVTPFHLYSTKVSMNRCHIAAWVNGASFCMVNYILYVFSPYLFTVFASNVPSMNAYVIRVFLVGSTGFKCTPLINHALIRLEMIFRNPQKQQLTSHSFTEKILQSLNSLKNCNINCYYQPNKFPFSWL